MKTFKKGDYINCDDFADNEIIKFENHYLIVKENDRLSCEKCFFNNYELNGGCAFNIQCNKYNSPDNISYYTNTDYDIIYEKLSKIEVMILTGDKDESL